MPRLLVATWLTAPAESYCKTLRVSRDASRPLGTDDMYENTAVSDGVLAMLLRGSMVMAITCIDASGPVVIRRPWSSTTYTIVGRW